MFRSVFPAVSQHLKPSGKKGEELGVFTAKAAASRKASVCGAAAQWELRVTTASSKPHEGKPNYLLQEARNEEALARLDTNLLPAPVVGPAAVAH